MVNARRGQAAMEYLMTYGWALLVIVLVLGALIYLQVLNPQSRLQDTCNLPVGWKCEVASFSDQGTLTLKVTNQQAVQLNVGVVCKQGTGTPVTTDLFPDTLDTQQLSPGQSYNYDCDITGFTGNIGDSTSGEVFMVYGESGSDTPKYLKGTFTAKVSTLENEGP